MSSRLDPYPSSSFHPSPSTANASQQQQQQQQQQQEQQEQQEQFSDHHVAPVIMDAYVEHIFCEVLKNSMQALITKWGAWVSGFSRRSWSRNGVPG
jgi:Zn/Cd-binding protein ZinT